MSTVSMDLETGHRATKDFVFFNNGFLDAKYNAPMKIDGIAYSNAYEHISIMHHDYIRQHKEALSSDAEDADLEKIAFQANLAKFEQNIELQEKLLKFPMSADFVNADTTDLVWGSGVDMEHIENTPKTLWPGRNLMGIAITKVRGLLAERVLAIASNKQSNWRFNREQKALLLSFGFLRRNELFAVLSIPKDIVQLVAMFCTFMFEEIRFTCFNAKNCVAENDGMILKTSEHPDRVKCHRLFVADQNGFNHGVVVWRLKFACHDKMGSEGCIGVISGINNKDHVLNARPWINDACFADTTYWSRAPRKITAPAGGKNMSYKVGETWEDGDIIDVKLDCEQWCIQFYRNEKLLTNSVNTPDGKIPIYANKTYYPIIAFFERNDVYSVSNE